MKITTIILAVFSIFLFSGFDNADKEKILNAQHAIDVYGNYQQGLDMLSSVSAAGQSDPLYLSLMGRAYDNLGDKDNALIYYQKYLAIHPSDAKIAALKQRIEDDKAEAERKAEAKRNCWKCHGTGYYMGSVDCGHCSGTGQVDGNCSNCYGTGSVTCSRCKGSGSNTAASIINAISTGLNNGLNGTNDSADPVPCSSCDGTGKVTCSSCDGSGRAKKTCYYCNGTGSTTKQMRCDLHD